MRTLIRVFAVAMVAAMASCASAPTDEEMSAADYGTAQTLENCQSAVKAWFQDNLKDPDSARYGWDAHAKRVGCPVTTTSKGATFRRPSATFRGLVQREELIWRIRQPRAIHGGRFQRQSSSNHGELPDVLLVLRPCGKVIGTPTGNETMATKRPDYGDARPEDLARALLRPKHQSNRKQQSNGRSDDAKRPRHLPNGVTVGETAYPYTRSRT